MITLGVDLGTGSVKVAAIDDRGRLLARAERPYPIVSSQPGWVESDPAQWQAAAHAAADEVLGALSGPVAAVGFAGQMHGVVLSDGAGGSLGPAILWADRRASREAALLAEAGRDRLARLGSPAVPGFAATTLAWLQRHRSDLLAQAAYALQPKDWLRVALGGSVATDTSDATGTLLCEIAASRWDDDVVGWTGIRPSLLPPILAATDGAGSVELAGRTMPAVVGGADTACMIVGLGWADGFIAVGTGAQVVCARIGPQPDHTLRTHTFAEAGPAGCGWYRLGAVQNAGLALTSALRLLAATPAEAYAALGEDVKASDPLFIPYLAGERTPFMDEQLHGGWQDVTRSTDRPALLRSVLEGIAHAIDLGRQAVQATGVAMPQPIPLIGGGAHDPRFRRLLADVTGCTLLGGARPDAAAIGAATLAQGRIRCLDPGASPSVVMPRSPSHALLRERQQRMVAAVADQQASMQRRGVES
ncbi:MAG: hypothetical protein KGP10_05725 [Actinomycetales bacterium]|nr:hypothetical protein [Actinomycetales bacterium]